MARSKKLMVMAFACVVALAVVPIVAGVAASPSAASQHPAVIHVVEHAITDTVQQFHPPANSLGDVLGFHNPVFDATDTNQVATDNGSCIRTVATGQTEWECTWTTLLQGGNLTVEGPYYDDGTDTTLTITGGTGKYTGADGSMLLHARGNPVGSEYDFIFTLDR